MPPRQARQLAVCKKGYAGVLAGGLYTLWYYSFDFWNTAQTDGFQTLPTALGVLAFLFARDRDQRWAYVVSGVGVGLATLFKYPMGLLLPLLMLLVLVDRRADGIPAVVAMGLGFCLSLTL
ncbi:glycosyltransferase family 39 protein, partial [Yoonia sp.]|uniref:glycosyltransferase family 39 protein n=1 Tax=Yoonia sp. TaxID=2212373 RepID=UPI003975BAF6